MRTGHWTAVLVGLSCLGLACGDGELVLDAAELDVDEGELDTCREGNCRCFVELAVAMSGAKPNMAVISQHLGGSDPANVFAHGGSENIPLTCRTAKYYVDHDPAWLERYFRVQLDSGNPPVFGGELFSSTYASLIVGDAIAALAHARKRGHASLAATVSSYLRAYWASLSLAAVDVHVTQSIGYNVHGTLAGKINQPGYNTGIVGARSYVNTPGTTRGNGAQYILLSMALEHPWREVRGSLEVSPGYYGGLRAAVEGVGYQLDSKGKVNLRSRSVPPEAFGLTSAEREALARFIQSGGQTGLATVRGMLEGIELACPLTIIRTSGGVISWFGTSDTVSRPCNGRKGGSWAIARLSTAGTAEFVTRSSEKYGGGDMGTVERSGNEICAQSSTLPRKCLSIPSGSSVYEVVLGPGGGARCVGSGCTGTTPPPPPPPTSTTDGAAYLSQQVPTRVAPGATFQASITMRNSGTSTWTAAEGVRLGSQSPQDNLTWGPGRLDLAPGAAVPPGGSYTFTATFRAPSTTGVRPFQWRMLREGVHWFGSATPVVNISVSP